MSGETRVAEYARQARQLMPIGLVWEFGEDTTRYKLWQGVGDELCEIEDQLLRVVEESDPRTAIETLAEWESMLDIPGACGVIAPTTLERQANVFARYTRNDPTSVNDYIAFASSLGFAITVEEYQRFEVGRSTVGEALTNDDPGWPITWNVHLPLATPAFFSASRSAAGEPLVSSSNARLECELELEKPAHTIVIFTTDAAYSGWAPWNTLRGPSVDLALEAPAVRITVGT